MSVKDSSVFGFFTLAEWALGRTAVGLSSCTWHRYSGTESVLVPAYIEVG